MADGRRADASAGPPVVALIGPTGSGKSSVAMRAAGATGAAIVAVDAFTVYRQLSIGTAKPTPQDMAAVPHRMVDVLDVEEACTVRWFQEQARAAIAEEREAGRPVLLVGGSGLYFRAVVDPLEFPPTDPDARAVVEARVASDPEAGFEHLQRVDPDAAARMDPLNVRRIVRALEVLELTGRTFSSYRTAWETHDSIYDGLSVHGVGTEPEALRQAIGARVDRMLAAGWLEECRALVGRELSETAAQAIGYAELHDVLVDASDATTVPMEVRDRIAFRTRRFANRQRRWFRGDPRVAWATDADLLDRLVRHLDHHE